MRLERPPLAPGSLSEAVGWAPGRARLGDERLLAGPVRGHTPGEGGVLEAARLGRTRRESDVEDGEHADLGLAQAEHVPAPDHGRRGDPLSVDEGPVGAAEVEHAETGGHGGQGDVPARHLHVSHVEPAAVTADLERVDQPDPDRGLAWLADLDDGVSQVTALPSRSSIDGPARPMREAGGGPFSVPLPGRPSRMPRARRQRR